MMQNKNLNIKKSTFKNNKATYGGAIFHKTGKLTLSGNKFSGNKAKSGDKVFSHK